MNLRMMLVFAIVAVNAAWAQSADMPKTTQAEAVFGPLKSLAGWKFFQDGKAKMTESVQYTQVR